MVSGRKMILIACCLSGALLTARPAAGQWKAGLAVRKITPTQRVYLAGYASRNKPFESVAQDLYVKALALQDQEGRRAVLVTSDLIGFREELAEQICAIVKAGSGLERHAILLNASHTHTGPMLSLDPGVRGRDMTEAQAADTVAYTKEMIQLVAATIEDALREMKPARLSYGVGVARFVMNRREFTERGVRLGVNPRGLVDRSVPVLRVNDDQGQLRAVVFGAACHNTTLTGRHFAVSGDYAGFAQHALQEAHPKAQAMFMMGCGGSANPFPRGTLEDATSHGRELAGEVLRVLETDLREINGPLTTLLEYVELPLQRPPSKDQLERLAAGGSGWQPWVARQMQERLEKDGKLPTSYRCPVAVWQFGDDLTLVGLSGEVVVDYVPLLAERLGPLKLWIAAYCNDVFGYIPSKKVLAQGGYETRGVIYAGIGFFAPEAEDLLVEAVGRMAEKVRD